MIQPKNVPDQRQHDILIDIVKNPMKSILGDISVEDAINTLKKKFKYSDIEIKKLKEGKMTNRTRILLERKIRQIVRQELSESRKRRRINESPWDGFDYIDDAVEDLCTFADNESKLYDVLHNTYVPALMKFKKRGTFDREKALKLLEYYYQNYVRPTYKKRFGSDIKLNPAQRKNFANYYLTTLEEDGYLELD